MVVHIKFLAQGWPTEGAQWIINIIITRWRTMQHKENKEAGS